MAKKEKEEKEEIKTPEASPAAKQGLVKVKATLAEVKEYEKKGVLYGWNPHDGIATIRT